MFDWAGCLIREAVFLQQTKHITVKINVIGKSALENTFLPTGNWWLFSKMPRNSVPPYRGCKIMPIGLNRKHLGYLQITACC